MIPAIILASASKRRSRILKECGIPHRIMVSHAEEISTSNKKPAQIALYNATIKAASISKKVRSGIIIGADTLVASRGHILGKPATDSEARQMLTSFSEHTLSVYTGICLIHKSKNKKVRGTCHTKVRVKKLSARMIDSIVTHLDPCDRAGGFSIEGVGSYIFDSIDGSFYNVLGLPTITLYELFRKLGFDLLYFTE